MGGHPFLFLGGANGLELVVNWGGHPPGVTPTTDLPAGRSKVPERRTGWLGAGARGPESAGSGCVSSGGCQELWGSLLAQPRVWSHLCLAPLPYSSLGHEALGELGGGCTQFL